MVRKLHLHLALLGWSGLCCLMLVAGAWAQESTGSGTDQQTPLGAVVKRQREQRQYSKTAKKVVTDDDIPANHTYRFNGYVAEYRIIPAIRISGLVPISDSPPATAIGQKKDKIYIRFGPTLMDPYACDNGTLDCAEQAFLGRFQHGGKLGSAVRILFDLDDTVQNYPARVAHFEVTDDVRGKIRGSVALIRTPIIIVTASCLYSVQDQAEAEAECETFISSLNVDIPEKRINVDHPSR
ncbi:MAG: hypothetical protein ACLPZJ_05300 [Terriglobales bacterium]